MTNLTTIFDWAKSYTGDPDSFESRGMQILGFLREEGLQPVHRLLDIGCGCLSQGIPIIRLLELGHYYGLEPNGWLVLSALEQYRDLESKQPRFLWGSDFDASGFGVKFDYVISHSVMSHMAHWQMEQALAKVRAVVDEGAVWLSSYRNDQYNSFSEQWVYPGVAKFRLKTIQAIGVHTGWAVEPLSDHKDRLAAVAPNDTHDWIKLTACKSLAELNEIRLEIAKLNDIRVEEEAAQAQEREQLRVKEEQRLTLAEQLDRELQRTAGVQ